jgi:predicted Ser/Thr protein kinase/tetratricopeptide (TPR) repeat protein
MSTPLSQVGRYQIIEKLGQGGMGSLYLARDPAIDRLVAIKLLRDDFDSQELRERFAREARSAGRLRHPNIVVVFDVGDHEGQPFIAMEYIPGETLGAIIKRGQALKPARVLEIVEDICAGLDYAHGAGIVHRDVKPANIMIDSSGVVKILDFGIAHVAESGMTKSGSVVGTLNYMAPEQVLGKPIDRRCDVFAVGAVLYELLTLRQAFPGGLQEGILNRIVNDQPVPLSELCPSLDSTVERIVKKSLEKDPAHRYADLAQMQEELAGSRTMMPEMARPGADAVTQPLVEPRPTERPAGGRRDTEREMLAKRRAAESEEHLRTAEAAFEAGDYQAALDSSERAALLDHDGTRALDLMTRARTAVEEARVLQIVGEARAQLHEGALTAAGNLLDQAVAAGVTLRPESPASAALERARLDLDTARERTALVRKTMQRANGALDRQEFESAIRSANEALALDPVLTEALNLRRRAQAAIEKQRRERERQSAPPAPADATAVAAPKPATAVQPARASAPDPRTSTAGRRRVPLPVVILVLAAAAAAFSFALWPAPEALPTVQEPAGPTAQTTATETSPSVQVGASTLSASSVAPAAAAQPTSAAPAPRAANQPPVPVNPRTFGSPSSPTLAAPDDAAIRQTLQRYQSALENLDSAAVKAVFPTVNMQGLETLFSQTVSVKEDIQVGSIAVFPDGKNATVTASVTTRRILKSGRGGAQHRDATFRLRKNGDSWLIGEVAGLGRRSVQDEAAPVTRRGRQ